MLDNIRIAIYFIGIIPLVVAFVCLFQVFSHPDKASEIVKRGSHFIIYAMLIAFLLVFFYWLVTISLNVSDRAVYYVGLEKTCSQVGCLWLFFSIFCTVIAAILSTSNFPSEFTPQIFSMMRVGSIIGLSGLLLSRLVVSIPAWLGLI